MLRWLPPSISALLIASCHAPLLICRTPRHHLYIRQSTLSSLLRICDIRRWNSSGAHVIPNGSLLNWKRPYGVMNVVRERDWSANGICQNPLLASNFEKVVAPDNCARTSSTLVKGNVSCCTLSLSAFKSTQTLMFLCRLGTTTIPRTTRLLLLQVKSLLSSPSSVTQP